ncbi:hypothetical protein [Metabacillus niabensis]|uniref:hypothetical protein n=1 Tax=Metabacillus niabensis TaxID=324854 RepID=UPI0015827EAF|nr:hypothetical protein [Metabacillus niabensis]
MGYGYGFGGGYGCGGYGYGGGGFGDGRGVCFNVVFFIFFIIGWGALFLGNLEKGWGY